MHLSDVLIAYVNDLSLEDVDGYAISALVWIHFEGGAGDPVEKFKLVKLFKCALLDQLDVPTHLLIVLHTSS